MSAKTEKPMQLSRRDIELFKKFKITEQDAGLVASLRTTPEYKYPFALGTRVKVV